MKIGLIGLPNSGKTTIFNALTRLDADVTSYATMNPEPNIGRVEVDDDRITRLVTMYMPRKITKATIEMVDFPGIEEGSAQDGAFSGKALRQIKNVDALALVVRNFHDDVSDSPTPLRDIDELNTEFLLDDMIIAEKRLEKITQQRARGLKTGELQAEEQVLWKVCTQLNDNQPIRDLLLNDDEVKLIRGFQFLTQKPFMIILNSDETNFGRNASLLADIDQRFEAIEFAGRFEMELSGLADDEASLFMEDMGIRQSARERLSQFTYRTLGYLSFFTVGQDEVRAWSIHRGKTAVDAAGAIHTDLARGFIRAECFSYDALVECGSEKYVREKGRFRLEGKDYIINDGDILAIRFNV